MAKAIAKETTMESENLETAISALVDNGVSKLLWGRMRLKW